MEFVVNLITVHVKLDGKVVIVKFALPYLDANKELVPMFLNAIVKRSGGVPIVTYVRAYKIQMNLKINS